MKTKKKSALQKRREDPSSRLWKRKADDLWRRIVTKRWNNKCAVCQSSDYVQAHHLIPRELKSHRHTIENGIALCARCHKYSFELSAHRGAAMFFRWLMINHPTIWEWILQQKPSKDYDITYRDSTEQLAKQIV